MVIKLILSTGKEIELTEEEYNELRNGKELVGEPIRLPYYPVYPTYPVWPWNQPIVTYTTTNCVADKEIE